jgi:hypothetical protein
VHLGEEAAAQAGDLEVCDGEDGAQDAADQPQEHGRREHDHVHRNGVADLRGKAGAKWQSFMYTFRPFSPVAESHILAGPCKFGLQRFFCIF